MHLKLSSIFLENFGIFLIAAFGTLPGLSAQPFWQRVAENLLSDCPKITLRNGLNEQKIKIICSCNPDN